MAPSRIGEPRGVVPARRRPPELLGAAGHDVRHELQSGAGPERQNGEEHRRRDGEPVQVDLSHWLAVTAKHAASHDWLPTGAWATEPNNELKK